MGKIFFVGTTGINARAYSKYMEEAEVHYLLRGILKESKLEDRSFLKLRVEVHGDPESDNESRIYIWGEVEAGFQSDDFGGHIGTRIIMDGVEVFNNLVPSEGEDPEDHEECEECCHV
jgi:hypothetical protein